MTILTQTLSETAMINLSVMQKKARKEFLDFYVESTTPTERSSKLDEKNFLKYDHIFLPWLKQEKVLFKLNYLDTANPDADKALQAYHDAINDYYCKYFMNSIIKPFNMNIDDYITRMNEYAELLQYIYRPHQLKDANPSELTGRNLNRSMSPTFMQPFMMICQQHIKPIS